MTIDEQRQEVFIAAQKMYRLAVSATDRETFNFYRAMHESLREQHEVLAALVMVQADTILSDLK